MFPFLQSLEARKVQLYKREANCHTDWRYRCSTYETKLYVLAVSQIRRVTSTPDRDTFEKHCDKRCASHFYHDTLAKVCLWLVGSNVYNTHFYHDTPRICITMPLPKYSISGQWNTPNKHCFLVVNQIWGKFFYLQFELFCLQLSFFACSPLGRLLDALFHCKQKNCCCK